ncbi:hypothetical protein T11_12288 [Trichinella zimbabwensis]|uniref:Uncharacterized protein n=1 Tax=Trichinella zimbabwensis TaxID=268475 RepID=A0A0V1GAR6_9BILA|nr:hypothetical protein T11_12288 [Trichinella zimbabwensis]
MDNLFCISGNSQILLFGFFRFSNSGICYLIVICEISLQWHQPLKAVLGYV